MNEYVYNGPVTEFNRCIANNWHSSTLAVSEKKARSNLIFQFKREYGKAPNAQISLPGKIKLVRGKENAR